MKHCTFVSKKMPAKAAVPEIGFYNGPILFPWLSKGQTKQDSTWLVNWIQSLPIINNL